MKFKIAFFWLILLSVALPQEVLDKIVAVVDNEIILQSELDFQTSIYARQRGIDPSQPGLKKQILNSMIEDKLIYAQSELDSTVVTEDEISQRIDYQIQSFQQQYGSIQKIEEMYGMSIEKIKRELRDDVRKNLMIQKLQQTKFGEVEATRREVEEFYKNFKDSIGVIPEKFTLYHIFKNPQTNDLVKKKARELAQSLLDSIKAGADFEALAKKYSDDPGSASLGGDLGFVKRGVFYPEFEAAAFALNENEISGVVETPIGFHIIQMLERRGESIHTRHILIKIEPDDDADLVAIQQLTDLRDSVINGGAKFQDLAEKYSDDKETAPFGGSLGDFYLNQLEQNKSLFDVVSKLKEGEISFPKRLEYGQGTYGYHIVYLEKRIPQHPASLEEDYNQLKQLASEYKKQKKYQEWMNKLKKNIYWEIRI